MFTIDDCNECRYLNGDYCEMNERRVSLKRGCLYGSRKQQPIGE